MSLRYTENSNGPRMDPCGTPEITGSQDENDPLRTTRCRRVVKKHLSQSNKEPPTP